MDDSVIQNNESVSLFYDGNGRCTAYAYKGIIGEEIVYQMLYDDLGRVIDIEKQ